MAGRNLSGAWGEAQAMNYLRKKHFEPVAANYKSRFGEIDLIVKDKKYLVFVEVKLRRDSRFAEAAEFVDKRKQQRLRTTAEIFLAGYETNLQPRFDVIEIYAPEGEKTLKPAIKHWEDAFI